jgi:hypothetical protein
LDCLQALLEYGAGINITDQDGSLVPQAAVIAGHVTNAVESISISSALHALTGMSTGMTVLSTGLRNGAH